MPLGEVLIPTAAKTVGPSLLASPALLPFVAAASAAVLSVISTTPGIFPSATPARPNAGESSSLTGKVLKGGAATAGSTALALLHLVPEKVRWAGFGLGLGAFVVWLKSNPSKSPPQEIHIHINNGRGNKNSK